MGKSFPEHTLIFKHFWEEKSLWTQERELPKSNIIGCRAALSITLGPVRLPRPDRTAQNDIPTGAAQHLISLPIPRSGCLLGFLPLWLPCTILFSPVVFVGFYLGGRGGV